MANPPFGTTMFARVPLSFAFNLDAGAVDQQVQMDVRPAVGDAHRQRLLSATKCAEVRHRPISTDQPQQALDEPCCLPERDHEKNFHCQPGLDRGVAEVMLWAALGSGRRFSGYGRIEPNQTESLGT